MASIIWTNDIQTQFIKIWLTANLYCIFHVMWPYCFLLCFALSVLSAPGFLWKSKKKQKICQSKSPCLCIWQKWLSIRYDTTEKVMKNLSLRLNEYINNTEKLHWISCKKKSKSLNNIEAYTKQTQIRRD